MFLLSDKQQDIHKYSVSLTLINVKDEHVDMVVMVWISTKVRLRKLLLRGSVEYIPYKR
mgnify:FL=1